MRCPSCGYLSFDPEPVCRQCGAARKVPARPPEASLGEISQLRLPLDQPAETISADQVAALAAAIEIADDENLPDADQEPDAGDGFRLDEEIIPTPPPPTGEEFPVTSGETLSWTIGGEVGSATVHRDNRLTLPAEETDPVPESEPIIDRDDEVPERFWALEGAPPARRLAALVVDFLLVGALLGLFSGGALIALHLSGFDPDALLTFPVVRAALLPFGLLTLLLSLGYCTFFHVRSGRTPGKRLAGLEVRTREGGGLTFGRALLRWLAALLALAAAGVGVAWALFEPRRLGWADILSGTVLGEAREDRRA